MGLSLETRQSLRVLTMVSSLQMKLILNLFRWILFPTHTPRWLLKQKLPDSEAVTWFKFVHPQTGDPNWPDDCKPVSLRYRTRMNSYQSL